MKYFRNILAPLFMIFALAFSFNANAISVKAEGSAVVVSVDANTTGTVVGKSKKICLTCGVPQVKIPVDCKLASLYFTQEEVGPVAIRLYDADGNVIYDRYKRDRMFVKKKSDTYSLCESLLRRAAKVTITRCTAWVSRPMTFVGNVLRAFKESARSPIRLPL